MPQTNPIVLFAGGGTGGHIFPNLAVVERLFERRLPVTPHLLVSRREVDQQIARAAGIDFTALPAEPWRKSFTGVQDFFRGYVGSRRAVGKIIQQLGGASNVGALVATGGFVSAPAVSAAKSASVPVAVVSLDAKLGRSNKMMAGRADQVFAAMHDDGLPRTQVVGYPLRYTAVSHLDASSARAGLGLDPQRLTLLIFAGSQGAKTINEAMAEWMTRTGVARKFQRWQVLHYTGPADRDAVAAAYEQAGVHAVVEPFGHRMGLAWASADMALTRAGAGTVAEAWANTVPTVFLPYPYHRDEHQRLNVLALSNAGGAVLLRDRIDPVENVAEIAGPVTDLMNNAEQRLAMSRVLRDRPMGDGAAAIADWIEDLLATEK